MEPKMERSVDDDKDIEFSGKPSSFKDCVLRQLEKVLSARSAEMRGGYTDNFETKNGDLKTRYVADTREVFSGSVMALAILLMPKFSKKMKTEYKTFEESLKSLKDVFLKKSSVDEKIILGTDFYDKIQDKIFLEEYRMEKLELHQDLFVQLSILLGDLNWLEVGGGVF